MNQTLINNLNAKQIRAINRLNDEIENVLRANIEKNKK
jgi:hypothetical protein